MPDKLCAFHNCKNKAESRGRNKETGCVKRFKWCRFHRKGNGKTARLKLSKEFLN
jgi:hypothetical protein